MTGYVDTLQHYMPKHTDEKWCIYAFKNEDADITDVVCLSCIECAIYIDKDCPVSYVDKDTHEIWLNKTCEELGIIYEH